LGNSRVSFDTKSGINNPTQVDDYLPFRLEINRTVPSLKNEYLYNKKELQEELGQYDYGARFYDPVVARWTTIDPKAEKYFGLTPYAYANDRPVSLVDFDGRDVDPSGLESENGKRGLVKFLNTKAGRQFILGYLKKGGKFSIKINGRNTIFQNTGKDGKFASELLKISDENPQYMSVNKGFTRFYQKDGVTALADQTNQIGENTGQYNLNNGIVTDMRIVNTQTADGAAMTIGHEAFVHIEPDQAKLENLKQQVNDGTVQPGSANYNLKLDIATNSNAKDHGLLLKDQIPKMLNFVQQLNLIDHTTEFTKSYENQKKDIKSNE
jgi:RHS repeat-associated protein